MTTADLRFTHPATRGLRQILALSSDRFWFLFAVALCLLVSFEIMLLLVPQTPPVFDGTIGL